LHNPYLGGWSTGWVAHPRRYAEDAIDQFALGPDSLVVELASNDGYLLRWFVEHGVPVLGVEPAANVAAVAVERGVPTLTEFFGTEVGERLAREQRADLIVGNNVLAHVPDIHDFVGGIAALLHSDGRATLEFPHLLRLVAEVQFDTIYHEHFSYLSLHALRPIFAAHGLEPIDVEELETHGGSLRLHVGHSGTASPESAARVAEVEHAERAAGLDRLETYLTFGTVVEERKRAIWRFLLEQKEAGRTLAAYGAPAKGNTLLNYCGVGTDLLAFTVDANPEKQGTFLPGSRIPVLHPDEISARAPDIVVLLPWNLREELIQVLAPYIAAGGRLAVLHPQPVLL
jgi:hypothetical protein